jgi:small GTP-binding protein
MNVAADAFVNSAITGVNGGLVVLAADDPSMHSSQNEQDSRFYGKFAMIPMLEPSSQQEAYDMMDYAYTLSEKLKLPVLMRVVTRLAHSRAGVEVADIREENQLNPDHERAHWVLLPGNARKQYLDLVKKQEKLEEVSSKSPYNYLEGLNPEYDYEFGVIACGIGYNYVKEADTDSCHIPVLKVSQYPLPAEEIRTMADRCGYVLVVEDGQPFVEEQVKAILSSDYEVKGRLTETLPRTGELTPDNVGEAIGWGIKRPFGKSQVVMPRPPALCQGCGHRDVYDALNKVAAEYPDARIFGDIHGTTRDVIEDTINLQGVTFRFIDTAGIRQTNDTIENLGIERTFQKMDQAYVILWMIDSTDAQRRFEELKADILPHCEGKKMIILFNKSDLLLATQKEELSAIFADMKVEKLFISAKKRENITILEKKLVQAAALPEVNQNDIIITNVRHYEALTRALDSIHRVQEGLQLELSGDLVSEDLRQCIHELSEIVAEGGITSEETLQNIFQNFCIGK